jgi:hypothetical protein
MEKRVLDNCKAKTISFSLLQDMFSKLHVLEVQAELVRISSHYDAHYSARHDELA